MTLPPKLHQLRAITSRQMTGYYLRETLHRCPIFALNSKPSIKRARSVFYFQKRRFTDAVIYTLIDHQDRRMAG